MLHKLSIVIVTFWVGSLWMTGLTASILFDMIQNRALAGEVAGHLFAVVSYIGLGCGLYLLLQRWLAVKNVIFKQVFFWIVVAMVCLIVIGCFGIQVYLAQLKVDAYPVAVMESEYASQFAAWHGISGAVYLVECLLGLALVLNVRTEQ
ncbi:MAG: DUF4149 domain-containing protein [Methylophilaceae bacterium]|nr:DUF4149 domain-containing protein [Methylophilaceae bacterium]